MAIAELLGGVLGPDLPVAVSAYDGSRVGPPDAPATIVLRSPDALRRIVTAPGELGLGRAYVAGDLDVEGDLFAVLSLHRRLDGLRLSPAQWVSLVRLLGSTSLRPLPPPPEEARLRGRRHSQRARRGRDRVPLRRVERLLRDRPRTVAHVLLRGVVDAARRARGRAGSEARARSAGSSASSRACACSTWVRLGRAW